ncbi:MAG: DNA repair protein RecO [Candidatus Cloacimonetes bacterium]|nr:DNA repair protein RecO [Candidatus Cloacimonadota bacterium]
MNYQPDNVFQGILLKKTIFRETSLICDILTPQAGKIKILAKGVRNPKNSCYGTLQVLAELEFVTHRNKSSEWHILKTADLKQTFEADNLETTVMLQAGAELFSQMVIPELEAGNYFRLLKNYLDYSQKVSKNSIALFWRLLLRVFELNGIAPDFKHCLVCGKESSIMGGYHLIKQGFICPQCEQQALPQMIEYLSAESRILLCELPAIGNNLQNRNISQDSASQLTRVFITHLNLHFNDHFNLKSLKLLPY